jgi:two-component system cell cycle sensor histidine kinase/response regulator CckA
MKPPLPGDESERLRVLGEYGIMDSGSEPMFDDLTQLAAQLCGTPTALITLVDARRQWFKSRHAFAIAETDRDLSFCAFCIAEGSAMVVPDATQDSRFAGNPLVTGPPYIRFYAGVPLKTVEGHVLGTLCVIDYRPRQPTSEHMEGLSALARHVMGQLDLRRRVNAEGRAAASAESTVRLNADHHRAILDSALDAIVSMDALGLVTEFNPAAERMFGYSRAEAVGRPMGEVIVPPALRDQHARGLARYVASGTSSILGRRIEITAVRRDGTEFPVELSIQRIGHGEPPMFTGFIRDITQHKELEAQLRHSQKMEAIGQLAGGVAHDFNNILTVIQGHASLLNGEAICEDQTARASVEQIAEAAERAASLTRQLLAFSRKNVMQPVDLDVNEVVAAMIRMLHRILGEDIALRVELSPTPLYVHGDRSMMEQIILNLAVNARDAMPGGGSLIVRTSEESIGGARLRENTESSPGHFARLSVIDTGEGIEPAHLTRVFEPFFTTKEVNQGTGLGLATVYGIVKQHGGWINVSSEVGTGTTFDAYLPIVDRPPVASGIEASSQSVSGGVETILLVEDESPVRRLARVVLERAGYIVVEAANGHAALAAWDEHRDRIDLLLTDMVMPDGMSGLQVAHRILEDCPQMRVVVTSGYSVEVFGKELSQDDRISFLPKPYRLQQLLRTVRASIDSRVK